MAKNIAAQFDVKHTITWSLSMIMGDNGIDTTKKTGKLLAVLMAMLMWRCDAGRIARWSTFQASLEATECRHWASACAALPWRQPWPTMLTANTKILTKNFILASNSSS